MERELNLVKGQTLHGNYKEADVISRIIYDGYGESSKEKCKEDGDL